MLNMPCFLKPRVSSVLLRARSARTTARKELSKLKGDLKSALLSRTRQKRAALTQRDPQHLPISFC